MEFFFKYLSILKSQDRKFKFLFSRILWRTGLCRFFIINFDRYKIRFFPTALSASLWINSEERTVDGDFFERYLKEGDRFVDIGSNIGTITLMAASIVGDSGVVFSFEPNLRIFEFQKQNIILNGFRNIQFHGVALGVKTEHMNFVDSSSDDLSCISNNGSAEVSVVRLDEFKIEMIDLMKVDVEGYERPVFQGGMCTIEKTKCVIFESWEEHFVKYGYCTSNVIVLLESVGFHVYRFVNSVKLLPVANGYSSVDCENLVAFRDISEFIERTQYEIA